MDETCECGSGLSWERHYDGYGIYLFRSCEKCYKEKIKGFRKDIMDQYDCDEPIDEEY